MPLTDICQQPLSNCVTIDRTNNLALNNARVAFASASGHGETREAVQKLRKCLTAKPLTARRAMIVGHGGSGTIITGSGDVADDQDQRISFNNIPIWCELLSSVDSGLIQITSELTLCSCRTAAGPRGAKLLMSVANSINSKVSAFTGLIFINPSGKITCGAGNWLTAHPKKMLSGEEAPVHKVGKTVDIRLRYGDEYRTVRINNVFAVSFFDPAEKGKRTFKLEGEAAQELISKINFTEPAVIDGAPLALTTGMLEIEYMIHEQPEERTFVIFNDELLYDQATPNTFYFASPEFAEAISKSRPKAR